MSSRLVLAAGLCISSVAAAQVASRQTFTVDANGARVDTSYSNGAPMGVFAPEAGILWDNSHPTALPESACVGDTNNQTWAAWGLNFERVSYYQTTGNGTPVFEHDLVSENPSFVGVACAEDGSLAVAIMSIGGRIAIRAYTPAGGSTPIWTYDFPTGHDFANKRNIAVSRDGSVVLAAARSSSVGAAMLVSLDPTTGAVKKSTNFSNVLGLELSADGSRACVTDAAVAVAIETTNLTTLHSMTVSGQGGWHRISPDGKTLAAGGFNYRVSRENGGVWSDMLNLSEANNWFGNGIAVSDDASTLFVVSHNYILNYLLLTYRVIDLPSGVEVAKTTTQGGGTYQDSVQVARASADGNVLAIATWGTQDNIHPEVQVFDRNLNRIGFIDTPGSVFDIDLTRDGKHVVSASKAVHANVFGNGGNVIVLELDVGTGCYPDCDNSGSLDFFDFLCFQNEFANGTAYADCDNSGGLDFFDFLCFQNQFAFGCP